MDYQVKQFDIPALDGISARSVEEHLGLYAGYVKNFNAISKLLGEYAKEPDPSTSFDKTQDKPLGAGKNAHALSELIRRRSFEFGGMRLHEHYFAQFEGGSTQLTTGGALAKQFERDYVKLEYVLPYLTAIGNMRGPGWAILYWEREAGQLLAGFSGEQHHGHFATLPIILALDVWEHAYLLDYGAQGKGKYIEAFFRNLNWSVIERHFEAVA